VIFLVKFSDFFSARPGQKWTLFWRKQWLFLLIQQMAKTFFMEITLFRTEKWFEKWWRSFFWRLHYVAQKIDWKVVETFYGAHKYRLEKWFEKW